MKLNDDIYRRIAAAKMYIDEHYAAPIDLDHISQQACLSPFHFHRIFRKVYLHTPHQYLTRKRIDKAKDLLAENKPVADVCNEVGFESVGSFSTLFKKQIGFPPTYFRNIAWLKKQEEKTQPKKFVPHCFVEQYKIG